MSLHSVWGYAAAGWAGLGAALALAALFSRAKLLDRAMFVSFILCALAQVPALVTGVVDNAALAATAARVAPYNVFVGASFFTLTGALAVWRTVHPGVVWDRQKWLVYQAAAWGNALLGAALIGLGRLALGHG